MNPEPGHVLYLDQDASVQFHQPILLRFARFGPAPMFPGWAFLVGDQLDPDDGHVVERRQVYVRLAGVNRILPPAGWAAPADDTTTPTRSTP